MAIIHLEKENAGESTAKKLSRLAGPFYGPKAVMRRLDIDLETLSGLAQSGQVIAVPTSDGGLVYPTRQFLVEGEDKLTVNPAVRAAYTHIMEHEGELSDVFEADSAFGFLWTLAAALLETNEDGETLLGVLQQNLDNPEHESWERLVDLNGITSKVRKVEELFRKATDSGSQN